MARGSGNSTGVFVTGLTAAALAVIAFFAFQASAAQDRAGKPRASASESASPSKDSSAQKRKDNKALPARSGSGPRVVYALERRRVWLVGRSGTVQRTFRVVPSSVSPSPGTYQVSSRTARVIGSDGVPIEHVVRFTSVAGTTIGFSAAVDGSMPDPNADPGRKTGGVREKRKDGSAMWKFATIGTNVVVVR
ncbi:hypothetical protein [Streptomyces boncukensis]|uniref:Secreted protein n=1 Tax=Streptomyces boncukensis TaxID=2711219 RepID=A0A6G4WVY6_9ACTN|nr:hypothetical protein [Streptomyces boncukensis]